MTLSEHFQQRRVGATHSSFRSMVPLSTPSGAQWTESELETELLEQLAFNSWVHDLITQPIIEYLVAGKLRRYTPDIAVQLCTGDEGTPERYIIEVKRRADLQANKAKYAVKFEAARAAAAQMNAAFRIMDETRIRTPFLANVRLLRRYVQLDPDFDFMAAFETMAGEGQVAFGDAVDRLRATGWAEPDIRANIEHGLAWRLIGCDLTRWIDDRSLLFVPDAGAVLDRDADPILRSLLEAPSA